MSTNFPTSVDTYVNPSGATSLNSASTPHAGQHTNLNDAMTAVQSYLLNDPWTSFTSASSFANATGTLDSEYYVRFHTLHWRGRFTFTATPSTTIIVTLPTGSMTHGGLNTTQSFGVGVLHDVSTSTPYMIFPAGTVTSTTTTLYLYYNDSNVVSGGTPFTIISGDWLDFNWSFHVD